MLETSSLELMQTLSEIPSVSGNEKYISEQLKQHYERLADEIVYDNLGSIYAVKRSKNANAKRVMVSGHMDEVGFILKKVMDNGLIQGLALGEVEKNSLLGASIQLTMREGKKLLGTIVSFDENGEVLTTNKEVLIDFGFISADEARKEGIQYGDMLTFSSPFAVSSNQKRLFSHNWNGRYGVVLGLELLESLKNSDLDFDLYVGCTVQEQVGLRGIQTATNVVEPDLGIVLDTDKAFDYQTVVEEKNGFLGQGLLINFYDTTVLPNRMLIQTLKALCVREQIAHQFYYSLEGSDAAWINKLRTGTPTLFINVAIRNMNTPCSIMDVEDYQSARQALQLFIQQLTPELIEAFKAENR